MQLKNIDQYINEAKKGEVVKIGSENWKIDSFLPSGRINLVLGGRQKTITVAEYENYKKGKVEESFIEFTTEEFLNESLEVNQQALSRWKRELKGSTSDTGKVIAQKWVEHYKELIAKDKAKGAKVTEEKEEVNESKTKSQAMINRKIMDLKDCVKMIEKCNDKLYDPGMKDALGATLTNMDKHISDIRQLKTAATKAE